jgi:osmotically-inducible protein OsmY
MDRDRDQDIHDAVRLALESEPGVDAGRLDVSVEDGVVRLTGRLADEAEKEAAERAVHRVPFVRALDEAIELALPPPPDAEIADQARRVAYGSVTCIGDYVEVEVENGRVTLTGRLTWEVQRRDVERNCVGLPGVREVINNITVVPDEPAPNVRGQRRDSQWPL